MYGLYTKGATHAAVKEDIRGVLAAGKIHVLTRKRTVYTKAGKRSDL